MKNKRIIDSWSKAELDSAADERILFAILTRNHSASESKKGNVFNMQKKTYWKIFAPIAACLLIAIGIFFGQNGRPFIPLNDGGVDATEQVAYGFIMDGKLYYPISFTDRIKYGLVPYEDIGATPDNLYIITESDLGELMGYVQSSEDESLIGATVYHFAAFPNSFAVCIVDRGEKSSIMSEADADVPVNQSTWRSDSSYAFYTFSNITMLDGASSDIILNEYEMTAEEISKVEVLDSDWSPIITIEDKTKIVTLLEVLQGHDDIGLTAHEEILVNWLTAYDSNWRNNDQRFMELKQRCITITNKKSGIELSFIYNPFIGSICMLNSSYILTKDNVAILNTLFLVE